MIDLDDLDPERSGWTGEQLLTELEGGLAAAELTAALLGGSPRAADLQERLRADRHQPIRTLLRESLQLVVDPARVKNVRDDKRGHRTPIAPRPVS